MEKKIAHYPLPAVQALVRKGLVRATRTALEDAASLGFSFQGMIEVVENLVVNDFYKSMTSRHDNTLWQDVYRYPALDLYIYLKIQILENVVIVSFKEL